MNPSPLIKQFRDRREALGLYQWQVAQRVGLGAKYYQTLEAGKIAPRLSTIEAIARALGVRVVVSVVDDESEVAE